jgi:hypothetical protein
MRLSFRMRILSIIDFLRMDVDVKTPEYMAPAIPTETISCPIKFRPLMQVLGLKKSSANRFGGCLQVSIPDPMIIVSQEVFSKDTWF